VFDAGKEVLLLMIEMLHHALEGDAMTLRAEDKTSAGDNMAFLKSKLTWDQGEDGKERVLDADGNGWVDRVEAS